MSIYLVKEKATGDQRLVDAKSDNAAIKHVATDRFDVTIIRKPGEALRLMQGGIKLETAGEEVVPEKEDPPKSEPLTKDKQKPEDGT